MQHEIAESFFNDPVNPDALGIPEYREIVQVVLQLRQLGLLRLGVGLLGSIAFAREATAHACV